MFQKGGGRSNFESNSSSSMSAWTCTIYKSWQKCNRFKNLPEAIKFLKATTNNSRKIDPSNWLTLLITDWGYSDLMAKHAITHKVDQN